MAKSNELNVTFFLVIIFILAVTGFMVWLLWNWLMPSIFGLRPIHPLEAYGLLLLSRFFLMRPSFNAHN